ncbi:hypothetical protein C8R47DRAFT_1231364 [Mycena vitilis]|nr:hypothetical protein C8R47DRAFT_1231364 [Mycena vitilis]
MAMLPAEIDGIDHSFKLAKHIAKVNGEQIFVALLTVTNERGEIRVCSLVATKSHSQFELALIRMRESLKLYGHNQPFLIYTDNMADKDFLERVFASLREGILPVEKYAHLPALQIPTNIGVCVLKSARDIDEAMRVIIQDLPEDSDVGGGKLVIFVDSEWNVETSQRGYVTGRGQTAILQIGYKDMIYILQLGAMLAGGRISSVLTQILENPRILKAGRAVSGDLKYLEQATNPSRPFVGAVDIAKMAKDRLVVANAKVGLSDLCATTLGKRLDKNVSERISSAWDNENLTPMQVRYAALDVYACSCIYKFLSLIPIPVALPNSAQLGTPVLVFNDDRTRLIARGNIERLEGSFETGRNRPDGTTEIINISASRCLIQFSEVVVPAAILKPSKQTLAALGSVPFSAVCLRSHLRVASPVALPQISPPQVSPSAPAESSHNTSAPRPQPNEADSETRIITAVETSGLDFETDSSGLGSLLREEVDSAAPLDRAAVQAYEADVESQQYGEAVLADAATQAATWLTCIRSRVLKDPFHIFNMFYISVAHGLRIEFARALRDAIFIPDAEDKARIIAWGQRQNPPQSWEELLRKRPKWVLRRCKRIIPPPEQLYGDVAEVFRIFGPLKDATTGLPLFNHAAWAVSKNVLELIGKGYLSDPPGIALYVEQGIDKYGLKLYQNKRGTNFTEGGVHTHLRSRLPTSGVSVRHVNACLKDFIARHNLLVGTFNSTGKRYTGHYSLWIINEVQELLSSLEDRLIAPLLLTGWVNGNLYQPTKEVAGVLPIPEDVRLKSGMSQFESSLHSKQRHRYLAALQGTRKPVLPIHSTPEKDLFRDLMAKSPGSFSSPSSIDNMVRLWNSHADEKKDIYYKLSEQLKVYFNGNWKTNANIKQSKAMTAEARTPLNTRLRNPSRLLAAPNIPSSQLAPPLSMPISYSAISSGSAAPSVIASTHFIAGSSSARHDNSDTTRDQTYTNTGLEKMPRLPRSAAALPRR